MAQSKKKPLIVILLILVIPVVAFGVFQLNSLTVDERELTTIYRRQLESVLFSVNQTIQDKTNEAFGIVLNPEPQIATNDLVERLSTYRFFRGLYTKEIDGDVESILSMNKNYLSDDFVAKADSVFSSNQDLIKRLVRYIQEGDFQKIQSFDSYIRHNNEEVDFQIFITASNGRYYANIYFYNAVSFIEQSLVPKFQELAQGDFILTCSRTADNFQVYSTSGELVGDIMSEQLDLLPRFEVGIAREGGTVEQAVNKRKQNNLIALGLLMLVMMIGIGLVFFNIQKEMELAQKKADFVSNVSHEIRTPLALISMFAETLQMGRVKTEEKRSEYYGIITKEVARLTNMVNRILSFSKIEAGKREFHLQPIPMTELVEDVLNTYSYHLENNGFTHELEVEQDLPPVKADREAITEVMVNLIDNGMKYSLDEKHIAISVKGNSDHVRVAVKDSGIGIQQAELEKLFEKFYRVEKAEVHNTKGSGLGLTIVKHIMEAHNGSVEVQSKVGEGSIFTLKFPIDKNTNG